MTRKVALFKLFVNDQDQARSFYVDRLGFEVAEDRKLGPYRWLLVRLPGTDFSINLAGAGTDDERALVGRQAANQPLFSITTDDCERDYRALKARGVRFEGEPKRMPYGTGVMMLDLHGNKVYLNQDPV